MAGKFPFGLATHSSNRCLETAFIIGFYQFHEIDHAPSFCPLDRYEYTEIRPKRIGNRSHMQTNMLNVTGNNVHLVGSVRGHR